MSTTSTLRLPNITPENLNSLQHDLQTRQDLLRQIISTFEARYECSLVELERKLEALEVDEHPTWENSIEWRNAIEQLDQCLQTINAVIER